MPHRGSTTSPHLSMQLEPSLAPHDGLPGQHGTSRFCYGIIASKSGGGMKAGALAAAIHKAEQAAGSASPCSRGAKAGGGGGLLVGPAITLDALAAPGAPAPGEAAVTRRVWGGWRRVSTRPRARTRGRPWVRQRSRGPPRRRR